MKGAGQVWTGIGEMRPSAGLCCRAAASRYWLPDDLSRLLVPTIKSVPDAFERALFPVGPEGSFVTLKFAGDREVSGFFGPDFFASVDPARGGIFLEDIYVLGKDGY